MTTSTFNESVVEQASLAWFESLDYTVLSGIEIVPGETAAERETYEEPYHPHRLREAIAQLNPSIPSDAQKEACKKVTRYDAPSLVGNNRAFHRMLVDGVDVEYQTDRWSESC